MTNEQESKRIGERIAQLRKEQGMTQGELAAKAETNQGHIARIEQGKYDIRLSVLSAIAEALGTTVEFIRKEVPSE